MRLRFTKMHGAGNDFVVIDATRAPMTLGPEQMRALGHRRFGVGADQILVLEKSADPAADFVYRVFNGGSGDEVEQCGNGARCVARFALDKQLIDRSTIRVATVDQVVELQALADGRVRVDMGPPRFDPRQLPFDTEGLVPRATPAADGYAVWPLPVAGAEVDIVPVSMGNPHAVQCVADVDTAPVESQGPLIEAHPRFPRRVNAGYLQIVDRTHVRLRVYERGAGETLACGSGACAAVVAGIRLGRLDAKVDVEARGGLLTIEWSGAGAPVYMTGPATTVFEGEVEI